MNIQEKNVVVKSGSLKLKIYNREKNNMKIYIEKKEKFDDKHYLVYYSIIANNKKEIEKAIWRDNSWSGYDTTYDGLSGTTPVIERKYLAEISEEKYIHNNVKYSRLVNVKKLYPFIFE